MTENQTGTCSQALLGDWEEEIYEALQEAKSASLIERIWRKDPSVWKQAEEVQKEIAERLGWLDAPFQTDEDVREFVSFANEVAGEGLKTVVLMGMGGSSLAPELFQKTFSNKSPFPQLVVLDSTDAERVRDVERAVQPEKTLFIFASKSGTTTEPFSFFKYFFDRVQGVSKGRAGRHFIAITDPGTSLVDLAEAKGFRKVFLADPHVGGRYSALTAFGLLPAALIGVDIFSLLASSRVLAEGSRDISDPVFHPSLLLGLAMGILAKKKRDKLTLLLPPGLESFGDWIEQLIAESLGKEGEGIVPVIREVLESDTGYGSDRFFVALGLGSGDSGQWESRIRRLASKGHPVLFFKIPDPPALGGEFFRWEMATAIAGTVLGINPFDQPDVQSAKDRTKAFLEKLGSEGNVPFRFSSLKDFPFRFACSRAVKERCVKQDPWQVFWKSLRPQEVIHILAFLPPRQAIAEQLSRLRVNTGKNAQATVTLGLGPRYLHSTGQLHKGGPDEGIFLIVLAKRRSSLQVPGEKFTFEQLQLAQAVGDFEALDSKGRRAFLIELEDFSQESLMRLGDNIQRALGTR